MRKIFGLFLKILKRFQFFHRFPVFISVFAAFLVQSINGIVLECDFKVLDANWESLYSCSAKNLRTTLADRNVTEVSGVHAFKKSNYNVKKLYIYKQSCSYLPLNIGRYFTNLEILLAGNTNLKYLVDGDLDGLTSLKRFDVSWNPIEKLTRNFFKGHDTLEFISFHYCHLKVIDPMALDSLPSLEEAHFGDNICISYHATDMQDLKMELRDKCSSELYEDKLFHQIDDETSPQTSQTLSFTRRNVYVITSFFAVISIALVIVLVRIYSRKFGSWNELKEVLV